MTETQKWNVAEYVLLYLANDYQTITKQKTLICLTWCDLERVTYFKNIDKLYQYAIDWLLKYRVKNREELADILSDIINSYEVKNDLYN